MDRTLVESAVSVRMHRVVCITRNHLSVLFAGVSDEPCLRELELILRNECVIRLVKLVDGRGQNGEGKEHT